MFGPGVSTPGGAASDRYEVAHGRLELVGDLVPGGPQVNNPQLVATGALDLASLSSALRS